jgi:hypothetical protein
VHRAVAPAGTVDDSSGLQTVLPEEFSYVPFVHSEPGSPGSSSDLGEVSCVDSSGSVAGVEALDSLSGFAGW